MTTMRTNNTTRMWKNTAKGFALAVAVIGTLGLATAPEAKADVKVKVRARIHTPIGEVIVNGRNHRTGVRVRRPAVVRNHRRPILVDYGQARLSPRDYRVAWRLSYLTNVREGQILRLRSRGWTWKEIARYHDISRPVLKTALNKKRFDRHVAWVRSGRRGGHGNKAYAYGGPNHGDDDGWDDDDD